jgi:hypothetical protein
MLSVGNLIIISSLIDLVSVRNINDIEYIKGDVSYFYNTEEHKSFLLVIVPIFLLFLVVIPAGMFYKLNSNNLD